MGRHSKIRLDDVVTRLHEAGGPLPIGHGPGAVNPGMARALSMLGEADVVRVRQWGWLPTRRKMLIITPSGAFIARMNRRSAEAAEADSAGESPRAEVSPWWLEIRTSESGT